MQYGKAAAQNRILTLDKHRLPVPACRSKKLMKMPGHSGSGSTLRRISVLSEIKRRRIKPVQPSASPGITAIFSCSSKASEKAMVSVVSSEMSSHKDEPDAML